LRGRDVPGLTGFPASLLNTFPVVDDHGTPCLQADPVFELP
jgi:hypothetical protein